MDIGGIEVIETGSRLLTAEDVAELTEHIEQLESENAKLRELAVDAHACKETDGCCEDCYADEGDCPIELRMRELGIERWTR